MNELIAEFKNRANENGIPIFTSAEWKQFRNEHDKQDIRNALAEYVHQYNVKFPLKKIGRAHV